MMTQSNLTFTENHEIPEGYKKTEVGFIPENWNVVPLMHISEKIMVGIASSATHAYRNKGIPLLRNQNIKSNKLDDDDIIYISEEYEKGFFNKRLKEGDLLTARTGYPGTTCLVPKIFENAQSFTTLITRLKSDSENPIYLSYFINSEKGQKFFTDNQIGGGQKNVNAATLKRFPVIVPPLNEQQKIATVLSDTDALISELEKLIEKKQAIKTATMQQLLTGKTRLPEFALREDGTPKAYKDSELGQIPEDWSVMQLDQICDVVDPHPSHRAPPEVSNGIPFLGIGDFDTDGNIIKSKLRLVDKSIYDEHSKRYDLNKNLLGLGRVASIGKVIRLKNGMGKYTISPTLGILQSNSIDTDFLYYFLQSNRVSEQFSKVMSGSTRSSVGMIVLRQLNIIVPSTNESSCIGQLLKVIEDDIRSVSEKLNKLKDLKQGMMQELLTGRTRLV